MTTLPSSVRIDVPRGYPHVSLHSEDFIAEGSEQNATTDEDKETTVSHTSSPSSIPTSNSDAESGAAISYSINVPFVTSNERFHDHGLSGSTDPLEADVTPVSATVCVSPSTTAGGSSADSTAEFSPDRIFRRNSWHRPVSCRRRYQFLALLYTFGAVALIALIILLTTFFVNRSTTGQPIAHPAADPTTDPSAPSIEMQNQLFLRLRSTFRQYSDPSTFLVPDSPQSRALTWFWTFSQDPTLWEEEEHTSRLIQRYALIILTFSCSGDAWFNVDMLDTIASQHECTWPYVTCDQNNNVTGIDLNTKDLTGSLPEEIGALTNLRFLRAAGNRLEGNMLPLSVYGKLSELEELILSVNAISSSIPTEIGLLSDSLIKLDFAVNFITGKIPEELKLLSKLRFIDVSSNYELGGRIFDFIPFWPNLKELYVGQTKFTGSLAPWTIELHMTNLIGLDVRTLPQYPTIPTTIGLLTNMSQLRFGSWSDALSPMQGTIPTEIGLLQRLTSLVIEESHITGTIPTEVGLILNMTMFVVVNSQLSSTIPSEMIVLSNLRELVVAGNHLSGTIPSELGLLSNLNAIFIEGNELMVVPNELCHPGLEVSYSCDQVCTCCLAVCIAVPGL